MRALAFFRSQETVKDGNILRGWDSYQGGTGQSSGAIRRINRFREADRMFSASSVTSGQQSTFNAGAQAPKAGGGVAASAAAGPAGAKIKKKRSGG